jgi:hypothetical protein
MDDPLLRYKELGFSEAYSLERVAEVVKGQNRYRIEVFRSVSSGGNASYHAHAYRVVETENDTTGDVIITLVSLGSESENTPEKALASALNFTTP